ncbi:MAG: D-alanyl-D-alanine carboxypeptidase/D-alanyl-D-alanine-endopeptidase [Pseudomonadota bacterium]
MVRDAGLGGKIAYLAVEARTGRVIDALNPGFRMPPASVAKAATAYYSLSKLGAAYRFETVLEATGPVENGQITGDLILRGSGDPGFDSDAMADMIQALKDQGIHGVKGRFRVDASALPRIREIDPDQPDHVSYNPSVAGLNLNYNRVHFQWKKAGKGYDITLEARALRYSPSVRIARMTLEDRSLPVYTYAQENGVDQWTVARRMLGNDGARWLPVRRPVAYCDEVFRTIARAHGIVLKPGPEASGITGAPLVVHRSAPLSEMMESMLRYSTNLTAEVAGLTATRSSTGQPSSLLGSARAMNLWLNREVGARSSGFVDHSGLGYGARISPQDMVTLMRSARVAGLLPKILKPVNVATKGAAVVGKTGTLNFVSALSGYAEAPRTPPIVFAIFTGDLPRRDAIPVDQRERPPGARGWSRRSRGLQKRLIDRWLALASS